MFPLASICSFVSQILWACLGYEQLQCKQKSLNLIHRPHTLLETQSRLFGNKK